MKPVKTKEPDGILEKNVPLPVTSGPRSKLGQLLSKMKCEESFITDRQTATIYSLARYYGIEVAIRTVGGGKVRVWRVK